MMWTVTNLTVGIFALILTLSSGADEAVVFKLEAEDIPLGEGTISDRSEASNGKTLLRGNFDKGALSKTFCLKKAADFQILEASYSDDGFTKDKFEILVDDVTYGAGETLAESNYGHNWNRFTKSGPFQKLRLEAGIHILKIVIRECDTYGMEFDYFTVKVFDPDLKLGDFQCNVICVNNDARLVNSLTTNLNIRKAGIMVDMTRSTCPLDSNVKILFYHNMATAFRLEAIPPTYRTFLKMGLKSMELCSPPVSTIWRLVEFMTTTNLSPDIPLTSGKVFLAVKDTGTGSSEIEVTFPLLGPSDGTYLSNIGSKLTLKVAENTGDMKVTMRYKSGQDSDWNAAMTFTLSPSVTEAFWNIPDYSWSSGDGNSIQLTIPHDVIVEFVELKKREESGETVQTIWTTDEYTIEGVKYDFWWRSPDKMTVNWKTAKKDSMEYFDYIRVKATLLPEFGSTKAEIFTLYQDGRIRIVPVPTGGQESVPFGSSFVIGQPDVSHVRPNSPIEHVSMDVDTLEFMVSFPDGQCSLRLFYLQDKTVLKVNLSQRFYFNSPDHVPFILIESRYMEDGMSEIDHVAAEGGIVKHLKEFSKDEVLNGTSFAFFKRCISHLNTQSPELLVHVLYNE